MKIALPLTSLALCLASSLTLASGTHCTAPVADWQPRENLQRKLENDGYSVHRIKVDDGCYEVKATDRAGKHLEIKYDPKSFAPLKIEDD
ncbi:hypothetical protein VZ95_01155 [Elstera litoralis]|uniref:PepSY domain-containing protein n=1 Tax=Elstera litoralis TaxID=552518 RepID=A0A0F3IWJ8_9PROT|nr:PepSY domain-containing protein [Elstera litoralis]KJV11012.1 hypothetical protein VZ95_01155 [Elstera litoralis]